MKTVVVASGKGGTGKTTLSAVFAQLASQQMAVVVADGDVEASNLPLALGVADVSCTAFPGGARAVIDPQACTAYGLCAQACRFEAIAEDASGVYAVDRYACEGCGRCVAVCPTAAVAMVPSRAGEACVGASSVGPLVFGQLGPGEDLSGRLVTEVRRLASQAAERHQADVLVIDGPPGIGCPLITAIASTDLVVAVAEPTVSGAHDLGRLADVASRLGLPVCVVLNKADLSADGASRIRELCASRSLPLIAEVPFDAALADLSKVSATETRVLAAAVSPGLREAASAWRAVQRELGLLG